MKNGGFDGIWSRYDAVTFLKYLDTLRVSEGGKSIWIYAESSYKIFEFAKKRVYHVLRADGSKISMNSKSAANKKRRVNDDNNKNRGGTLSVLVSFFLNHS